MFSYLSRIKFHIEENVSIEVSILNILVNVITGASWSNSLSTKIEAYFLISFGLLVLIHLTA